MTRSDTVRTALVAVLTQRGYRVQSDTYGRGGLYLMGDGDLALALFEVHPSAREAIGAMYQGAWVAGLPPRFAVLPESARHEDSYEMLEQMRIVPLLYSGDATLEFLGLDELLGEYL